ncbi:hypothetical protein PENSPDRAFT_717976 [Peniophora sp. CONT]|nr:hypothetical protein PENSPDRAFT_717976 [Peniophora sp. CONT]
MSSTIETTSDSGSANWTCRRRGVLDGPTGSGHRSRSTQLLETSWWKLRRSWPKELTYPFSVGQLMKLPFGNEQGGGGVGSRTREGMRGGVRDGARDDVREGARNGEREEAREGARDGARGEVRDGASGGAAPPIREESIRVDEEE